MRLLDSLEVKVKKNGVFVSERSTSDSLPKSTAAPIQKENKAVDMGMFQLAESTYESIISAGIKSKLSISTISKEFEQLGMTSASAPDILARGINSVFKRHHIDLKAEVRSKNQISIIKYDEVKT